MEKVKSYIKTMSKEHGKDGALVIISTEAIFTLYGGTILVELGLTYFIAPLTFIPISIVTTYPLYRYLKNLNLF